ncbi:MAG: ribosomal L7Ae/L30e/S12e/Gadd45 family protein [Ethanoligenens sp.]|uniref:L7Ae/L30e/S12e/Gadd45 family ribosomal protein n=1 Tax=Ethanoligenens sp. TaxID=2099655 RepID=UPI0039EB98D1
MTDKLQGLLGFARRAGKLTFGTDAVLKDVVFGKALIVLLSTDASARTEKSVRRTCEETKTPCFQTGLDKQRLGACIGRGDTAVVAITDASFAKRMKELCKAAQQEDDGEYDDEIPRARGGQGSGCAK